MLLVSPWLYKNLHTATLQHHTLGCSQNLNTNPWLGAIPLSIFKQFSAFFSFSSFTGSSKLHKKQSIRAIYSIIKLWQAEINLIILTKGHFNHEPKCMETKTQPTSMSHNNVAVNGACCGHSSLASHAYIPPLGFLDPILFFYRLEEH